MSKVLMLRSSDGKVMVAPTWDKRPSATQSLPLETGVPSRALERVIQCWTKHALAEASGESRESLARWDADFARRLEKDGLTKEVAAAVRHLRLDGVHHGGRRPVESNAARPRAPTPSDVAAAARADLAVAWCAARVDPTNALRAAGADPVDAWCAVHADVNPVVSPDGAAASRACGRPRAEEEYACHHRKRPTAMSRPLVCLFFRSLCTSREEGDCISTAAPIQTSSFVTARPEGITRAQLQMPSAKSTPCYIKEATSLSP